MPACRRAVSPFGRPWSDVLLDDLTNTADIRVEQIPSRAEAERLVKAGDRAAVVVLDPVFSDRLQRCSFVGEPFKKDPINPLYRDGILTRELGVTILRNPHSRSPARSSSRWCR